MEIKIDNFEHKYIVARWLYSIAVDGISDAEYNYLDRYMKSNNLLPEYTNRTWSEDPCPTELLKQYGLEQYAYSVLINDATASIPSITSEIDVYNYYKDRVGIFYVSYKMDGFNIKITYYNGVFAFAQTRGRKSDALPVEGIESQLPKEITLKGQVDIIAEATLSDVDFKKLKALYPEKDLQSQRSAVRTALATGHVELVTFTAYDILGDLPMASIVNYLMQWGFNTPNFIVANNYSEIIDAIRKLDTERETFGQPTDGTVVRTNEGRELRAVRIYSWQESVYKSFITGYEEGFGTQDISFKAKIYPIKLKNSTQSVITLTNLGRAVENNLIIGAPIAFTLTSEAVGVVDLETTKLLHKQYGIANKSYKISIVAEEKFKIEHGF